MGYQPLRITIPTSPPYQEFAMQESDHDDLEFTDEQLRDALRDVGQQARQEAFAAGRPVFVIKGNSIVALHPDGREEVIETLCPETAPPADHQ